MDAQQLAFLIKEELPFTIVVNKIIFDSRISSKAKFYYVYLSSKPNGWKFHTNCIIKEIKEGRDAFYNGLKELIQFGYLERQQINEQGKFKHTEYKLKIPYTENTDADKPYTENTDYNNNNINKKDITKNDLIKEKTNKKENPAIFSLENVQPTVKENLTIEKPKKEVDFPQEFIEFYEGYEGKHPSKQKQTATTVLKKWKIMRKTYTNAEILLQVKQYAEYLQNAPWRGKKGIQFVSEKFLFEGDWIEKKLIQETKQKKPTFNNQYANTKPTTREFLNAWEEQFTAFDPTSNLQ